MTKKVRGCFIVGAMVTSYFTQADQLGMGDIPDIKEGLWESSTTMPGKTDKPMHTSMCTSNAVSKKMYEESQKNANNPCKPIHSERHGSVITQETECNFGGRVTHSTSVTTMTGNTALRIENHKADSTVQTVIEMKWVSACPAGMKLGDVTGPDGKIMMNVMSQ